MKWMGEGWIWKQWWDVESDQNLFNEIPRFNEIILKPATYFLLL